MSRDRSIFVYNPDVLHEQFAGLVIQRGLPFNHFDNEQTTRVFQNHLQPRYTRRVIAFEEFSVPHTGSALAKTLRNMFITFKLENKIMSITLDNASNNTSAIDHLDAQERKQDKSTLETLVDFEEEILDAEVQANEVIPLSDEEIAHDAASSKGFMSGPGSRGEEAEANYGYKVYYDDY
uniref:Zinc finger BED domain-containing protein RICESLEEPER 2-like n=1 Tax=Tanacetum cinerariifolium TaxID=118510 RepID=A0A6L2KQE9_TANCI|nr:zinc finger BED domain-containing protein RICESLEEPER 2-like [Tanacetum cinerariifolium]